MKLAAFDLEIAKTFPDGEQDWKAHRPLGISCAAVLARDAPGGDEPWELTWKGTPQLSREACDDIVDKLWWLVSRGYTIVTWNGAGFDFDVLAEESGRHADCVSLALNNVDLMFIVVALRGHFLGLDTAAKGMGIPGKLKAVRLNDGSMLEGMDGAMAPRLWAEGEQEAVLAYLREDVRVTEALARAVSLEGGLGWMSRKGRSNWIQLPRLYTVADCCEFTLPDVSWMSSPPSRDGMIAWTRIEEEK